jgi:hypothetical protein
MLPIRGTGNAKSRIEMLMSFIATFTLHKKITTGYRQLKFADQAKLLSVTMNSTAFRNKV